MDFVSSLLRTFHLNTSVFERARFCGHWSLDHAGGEQATFHLVISGECWLHRLDEGDPTRLSAGDLLILPRDAPHRLTDAPTTRGDLPPERRPLADTGEAGTGVICGHFRFDHGVSNPLLDALPNYLLLRAGSGESAGPLGQLMRLLINEAENNAPGSDALVDRLSDALFIQAFRQYLTDHGGGGGLAAALAEPAIARALELFHDQPGRAWTLSELTVEVALSRSAFVHRFTELLGESPMAYLTRWRMLLAHRWLSEGVAVAEVAERCGYASEPGFSKAFKRHYRRGPGAVRRQGDDRARSP